MLHTTKWSPDTCSCIFEYTWDDTESAESRTHNLKSVVNACPEHQGGTESTVWNTVNEENPRKNKAVGEIIERAPDIYVDIAQNGTRTLKAGITIDFAWTGTAPNRIIKMIVKGVTLPQNHFDALQDRLNTRFGVGKVILENPG